MDITLTYTPNKPQQVNNRLQRDEFELRESATLLDQVKIFIQQLSQPFGFLMVEVNQIDKRLH